MVTKSTPMGKVARVFGAPDVNKLDALEAELRETLKRMEAKIDALARGLNDGG